MPAVKVGGSFFALIVGKPMKKRLGIGVNMNVPDGIHTIILIEGFFPRACIGSHMHHLAGVKWWRQEGR